tara:strand:+ start:245 stop:562 length:318 start_codon:yes stop_codon:yes gene_type:complete
MAEVFKLLLLFNMSVNPLIIVGILILSIYLTYFLFHKKKILKRFYHSTPESPRNDKKYYAIVSIFMLVLFFISNIIANTLALTWGFFMFLEWFGENWEHIEAKGK